MRKPIISIVVPVYNAGKYLCQCIESLRAQTYVNIEIILVDDGSKDHSREICLEFAEKDQRIHYYYQNNAGAAVARNNGIAHATGDYIGFVDSDDYIDSDMYEVLLDAIVKNDAQVAQILSRRVTDDGMIINQELIDRTENNPSVVYSSDEAIEHYLIGNHSLCSHLYDSTLFQSVRIPEGMSGEDLAIVIPLYCQCNKAIKINQYKYNYRFNPNSVTNTPLNQRKINLFHEYERQLEEYCYNSFYKTVLTFTISKTLAGILNAMILYGDNGFSENEAFFKSKLKYYWDAFKRNKYINEKQLQKYSIYLKSRILYKVMLIVKRKFYKRPLYGEE